MQEFSKKEATAYLAGRLRSLNELISRLSEANAKKESPITAVKILLESEIKDIANELSSDNKYAVEVIEKDLKKIESKDELEEKVDAAVSALENLSKAMGAEKEE